MVVVQEMTIREAVKRSFNLLSPADKRKYVLITLLQMSTAIFDLIGVFTLGLTGLLSLNYIQHTAPAPIAKTALRILHLDHLSIGYAIGVVALTATTMFILKGIIALTLLRKTLKFLASRSAQLSARTTRRVFDQSLLFIQERTSQQIAYQLSTGINGAVGDTLGPAAVLCCEISLLIVLTSALIVVTPGVTIGAMIYFGLIGFGIQRGLARWTTRISRERTQAEISSTKYVQESIGSFREIKVANKMDYYVENMSEIRRMSTTSNAQLQYIGYIPKYILDVALMLGATLLGAFEFVTHDLNTAITTLALFLTAGTRVMPSLLRLQAGFLRIRTIQGQRDVALRIIEDVTREEQRVAQERKERGEDQQRSGSLATRPRSEFVSQVSLEHVTFTYPERDQPALDDVTISVQSGQSLAVVGPSGAGKSTFADIILGVLTPDSGTATISGLPPHQTVQVWPGMIGYVPQTVGLIDGSIRRNVGLGLDEKDIDDTRVWEALDKASLADFIKSDGLTLDSPVGERGVRLSGGQRQRLGLARALYTQPQLLVLDEATSALDAETEHAINQVLLSLAGEVTLITIAHRLATVRRADVVIYIEDGRIQAKGTFDEVRAAIPGFDRQAELLGL